MAGFICGGEDESMFSVANDDSVTLLDGSSLMNEDFDWGSFVDRCAISDESDSKEKSEEKEEEATVSDLADDVFNMFGQISDLPSLEDMDTLANYDADGVADESDDGTATEQTTESPEQQEDDESSAKFHQGLATSTMTSGPMQPPFATGEQQPMLYFGDPSAFVSAPDVGSQFPVMGWQQYQQMMYCSLMQQQQQQQGGQPLPFPNNAWMAPMPAQPFFGTVPGAPVAPMAPIVPVVPFQRNPSVSESSMTSDEEGLFHPQPQRVANIGAMGSHVATRSSTRKRKANGDDDDLESENQPAAKRPCSESSDSSASQHTRPQYKALESRPRSWGRTRKFRYTRTGELDHKIRMTVEEMEEFIFENPRRLTLRIGRTPLGCNDRYGSDNGGDKGGAMKCRLACCLDRKGTMEKGTYRVVLDEQRGQDPRLDPFHNAGYVHLWCLERWLDLPAMITHPNIDVIVDDGHSRPLPGPRDTKCKSVRFGHDGETEVAQGFVDRCLLDMAAPADYPLHTSRGGAEREGSVDPHGPYEGTLGYRIAVRKRELDITLTRHDVNRPKANREAKSRFRDHLYNLSVQNPGRTQTRRPSGQKQIRSGTRRRGSSVMREHLARRGNRQTRSTRKGTPAISVDDDTLSDFDGSSLEESRGRAGPRTAGLDRVAAFNKMKLDDSPPPPVLDAEGNEVSDDFVDTFDCLFES